MSFWKLVFAVLVALGIYHFLIAKPAQPAGDQPVQAPQHLSAENIDQLFYQSCVDGLKSSVTQEQGYAKININEWLLCKNLVTEITMKDVNSSTTLVYNGPFSVVMPNGTLVKARLASSIKSEVQDGSGYYHYEFAKTYEIDNLTGFKHIAIGECNSSWTGSEGYLTIYSCN